MAISSIALTGVITIAIITMKTDKPPERIITAMGTGITNTSTVAAKQRLESNLYRHRIRAAGGISA
jgi:hypothetical protein